jgi:hypothetical protein
MDLPHILCRKGPTHNLPTKWSLQPWRYNSMLQQETSGDRNSFCPHMSNTKLSDPTTGSLSWFLYIEAPNQVNTPVNTAQNIISYTSPREHPSNLVNPKSAPRFPPLSERPPHLHFLRLASNGRSYVHTLISNRGRVRVPIFSEK